MQSLKFNKDAWHYRVARWGGLKGYNTDVCSYTRRFLLGSFVLLIMTLFTCLVLTPLVIFGAHFFLRNFFASTLIDVSTIVCTIYLGVLTGLAMFITSRKIYDKCKEAARQAKYKAIADGTYVEPPPKVKKIKPPKEPGFVKVAYRSWKQKYCVRIEIT